MQAQAKCTAATYSQKLLRNIHCMSVYGEHTSYSGLSNKLDLAHPLRSRLFLKTDHLRPFSLDRHQFTRGTQHRNTEKGSWYIVPLYQILFYAELSTQNGNVHSTGHADRAPFGNSDDLTGERKEISEWLVPPPTHTYKLNILISIFIGQNPVSASCKSSGMILVNLLTF